MKTIENLTNEESTLLQSAQKHSGIFKTTLEKAIDAVVQKKIKNLNQKQTQALYILADGLKSKIN